MVIGEAFIVEAVSVFVGPRSLSLLFVRHNADAAKSGLIVHGDGLKGVSTSITHNFLRRVLCLVKRRMACLGEQLVILYRVVLFVVVSMVEFVSWRNRSSVMLPNVMVEKRVWAIRSLIVAVFEMVVGSAVEQCVLGNSPELVWCTIVRNRHFLSFQYVDYNLLHIEKRGITA
jgi:hypothetical protein